MALRAPLHYTGLSGQDTIGPIVPHFVLNQEAVFLNGIKLNRTLGGVLRDYDVESSDPLFPENYDTIIFNVTFTDNNDQVEININDLEIVPVEGPDDLILDKLDDLMVAVAGSWIWDKVEGRLTMIDLAGNDRYKFDVQDTSDWASRERRQDLEV